MTTELIKEPIAVECQDGVMLKGVLLIPEHPKAVVQLNGGTATKKEFYLPFLEYLCENGFICCLWDYRDSGESAPESLKDCDYTFLDYGMKDMSAIKYFLRERFPELPFLIVAHSVGGQQLGFIEDLSGIKGVLACAVSTGYMRHMPLGYRILSNYFFFIFSPLSVLFTGYIAAKRFGIMEDLPKKVVAEWRDWCMKPNYFFNKKFYGKTVPEGKFLDYNFPIHLYWTTDDPISNKNSISSFWKNVKNTAPIEIHQIKPADYQMKSIGHHGFFKKKLRDTLWPEMLEKLNSFIT